MDVADKLVATVRGLPRKMIFYNKIIAEEENGPERKRFLYKSSGENVCSAESKDRGINNNGIIYRYFLKV